MSGLKRVLGEVSKIVDEGKRAAGEIATDVRKGVEETVAEMQDGVTRARKAVVEGTQPLRDYVEARGGAQKMADDTLGSVGEAIGTAAGHVTRIYRGAKKTIPTPSAMYEAGDMDVGKAGYAGKHVAKETVRGIGRTARDVAATVLAGVGNTRAAVKTSVENYAPAVQRVVQLGKSRYAVNSDDKRVIERVATYMRKVSKAIGSTATDRGEILNYIAANCITSTRQLEAAHKDLCKTAANVPKWSSLTRIKNA